MFPRKDERYEDGVGDVSGSGGHKRDVSWNSGVLFAKDDDGGRWGGSSSDADKLEDIALGK